MGYVYFICEEPRELFKIGRTAKYPSGRVRELQTGNPRKLRVYGWISTPEHVALELYFHKKFDKKRRMGEWFKITPRQIAREVNAACNIYTYYDTEIPPCNCLCIKLF